MNYDLDEMEKLFGKPKPININMKKEDEIDAKITKTYREAEIDPLIESLQESSYLSERDKKTLINLAHLFLSDMRENLLKDQFDLSDRYENTTPDEWATFLSDRIVNHYIRKHKNALLKSRAEINLADPYAKNKRDNLNLINKIEQQEAQNKETIVILRIPDKYAEDN